MPDCDRRLRGGPWPLTCQRLPEHVHPAFRHRRRPRPFGIAAYVNALGRRREIALGDIWPLFVRHCEFPGARVEMADVCLQIMCTYESKTRACVNPTSSDLADFRLSQDSAACKNQTKFRHPAPRTARLRSLLRVPQIRCRSARSWLLKKLRRQTLI
jgi:hypothetical protein